MKIKVTQEHIDQGVPGSPSECPVSLAITEQTSLVNCVIHTSIAFYKPPYNINLLGTFPAGREINEFIAKFDAGKYVTPCELEWAVPEPEIANMQYIAEKARDEWRGSE